MTIEEIIAKWDGIVSFPWTPAKLRRAGYNPKTTLKTITTELQQASDAGKHQQQLDKIVRLLN